MWYFCISPHICHFNENEWKSSDLANDLCKHFENSINIDGDGLREIFNNFNYTKEGRSGHLLLEIFDFPDTMPDVRYKDVWDVYSVKSAVEEIKPCPITMLDHAAYLGREFIRAEIALIKGTKYIQD